MILKIWGSHMPSKYTALYLVVFCYDFVKHKFYCTFQMEYKDYCLLGWVWGEV
jgi:hypothetical protein